MLTMETWSLKMEPWRVYSPSVQDSHHFDKERVPDSHWSEKLDPDPNLCEKLDSDTNLSEKVKGKAVPIGGSNVARLMECLSDAR